MGITIEEIIAKETEIAQEFQKVVDTHIINNDGDTIEEMCCDDTEVIEEHLQRCKDFADYHNQIADTMRKYQKIEKITKEWDKSGLLQDKFYDLINEVVEDGNDD